MLTTALHCSCGAAVDLGCTNQYRDAPFHRLNNCFLPMLNAFHLAAESQGCIHAENVVSAPYAVFFLRLMFPSSNATILIHPLRWNFTARAFPPPPRRRCGSSAVIRAMDDNRASRKLLPRYMNIPSLVSFAFARPFEYNVLVLRQRTRRFLDEVRLLRSLRETTGQQWQTYKGSETVEDLRLFRSARTAVGFHGAGLMNMVFSQAPLPQVYEVTTRLNGGKLWRSYLGKIVRTWNSRARGVVHVVPLQPSQHGHRSLRLLSSACHHLLLRASQS